MPVFEMMNLSFFPADVLAFFYSFLRTIKSDRNKDEQKVKSMQCIATVDLILVVGQCLVLCVFILSVTLPLNTN